MKIHKTSVYRLEIEKDCGCKARGEYEDIRYTKMIGEGAVTLCEKHGAKSKDAREILSETMLDMLSMQAEQAGKMFVPSNYRPVAEGDQAGVMAEGAENIQAMGATNLPKLKGRTERRDPTKITQFSIDRPSPKQAIAAAVAGGGGLNVVDTDDVTATVLKTQEGIEISTEIGAEAPEDPRLSGLVEDTLGGLDFLDADDAKTQGVTQRDLNAGE
jgi:hypothetical protein